MSRVNPPYYAFNGGEVDSATLARPDLEKYPRVCEIMENIIPLTQGGMMRAPGTQYIGTITTFSGEDECQLLPFQFSESETFVMVLTNYNIDFVRDNGFVAATDANAVIGSFTDQSAVPSSGGSPIDSGTGDIEPFTQPEFDYDDLGFDLDIQP